MTDIDELREAHEEIRAELALLDDVIPSGYQQPVAASQWLDTLTPRRV